MLKDLYFSPCIYCGTCGRSEQYGRDVADLAEFPNTAFVPTMEHQLSYNKNTVYCATLLYAWRELNNSIGSPLRVDSANRDLYLLNKSTSYVNTLTKDEFSTSNEIADQEISAGATFKKSLPFEFSLSSFSDVLTFEGVKSRPSEISVEHPSGGEAIRVLYYKNDDDFLIELIPKDQDHEIFLYMPPTSSQTFGALLDEVNVKRKAGEAELRNGLIGRIPTDFGGWRGNPKNRFQYPDALSLVGRIVANLVDINIQPLGGLASGLNLSSTRKGAEIESEAAVAVDSVGAVELPKPKKMWFDKPFFLMLKRLMPRIHIFAYG